MDERKANKKFLKLFTRNRPKAMHLLKHTKNKLSMINGVHADGRSPIHIAALDGDHVTLRKLMNHGAYNWKKCVGGFYPLHLAILGEHVKNVKILLEGDPQDFVPEDISKTVTEQKCSYEKCIFYSALETCNIRILKELVLKFFPLLQQSVIGSIVDELINRFNISDIVFILEKSKEGMKVLSHVDSLTCAIETENPEDEKTEYILEIGKYGYPLDMAEYYHQFLSRDNYDDNYLSKLFIRNKRKVINMDTPGLLLSALRSQNLEAIDILFAIGCDPKSVPDDEEFEPEVIRKLVLRGDSTLINTEPTTTIANDFRKQLTLFDLLYYRLYLSDLKRELRYDGSRKRQRQ